MGVQYALRDINKPIGVAEYMLKDLESLPKSLQKSLPTIEDIESELMPKKATQKITLSKKIKK
jgi:hypothetical protein